MSRPDGMCYAQYEPSLAAAIIFTVLFAGPTGLHLFQLWKYRTWSFIPFVLGGICRVILANADSKTSIDRGQTFITIGLVIQLVFFGLFIVTSINYDIRLRKNSTEASRSLSWETHIRILYISSALIVVRSISRLIEYLQGHDGELLSNEIYLYVFDAALMLLVMIVFNWKHPAILIAPSTNIGTEDIEARNSDNFLMHKVDTR
ncbi:hypothetical protein SLS56_010388 [Neofusicoccum ribis]|uniref:Uncharacterized protein n=1 Tax=Neofusicoccum ribis TaxID=45134 RepID=A0ABR3SF64_9PEZI